MKNCLSILLAAVMLIACMADVRPVAKNDQTSIWVSDDITFKYGAGVVTISAGTYRPIMQDDDGIFYISPQKLIWSTAVKSPNCLVSLSAVIICVFNSIIS